MITIGSTDERVKIISIAEAKKVLKNILDESKMIGWNRIIFLSLPLHFFLGLIEILEQLITSPKAKFLVDEPRKQMKLATKNYKMERTWKNLQSAIFSHTYLYILLGSNIILGQLNKISA